MLQFDTANEKTAERHAAIRRFDIEMQGCERAVSPAMPMRNSSTSVEIS
jgi:hypothetical protein